jgi:hypothetical protein
VSTKSREVLFGGQVRLRQMQAETAREKAVEALREADRAECLAWSIRMEGFGGPAQPSPTIARCLNGRLGWLEVKCQRCGTQASIPLNAIRRPRATPLWKLEASFGCRSCRTPRYKPRAHLVKLTETREITPYPWHHPDTEEGR